MRFDRTLRGLTVVLSLVALILGLELGARLFAHPPRQLVAYDPALGWRFVPNVKAPAGDGFFVTNSLGFRDHEHAPGPRPDVFRILLLGDSYLAAAGFPEEKILVRRLESKLNERRAAKGGPKPVEVIVGAAPAWSTDQQLLYWREIGRAWKPDLVLLVMAPNDIRESYAKRIFSLDPDGALGGSLTGPRDLSSRVPLSARAFWFLLNHSALAQWLAARTGRADVFPLLARYFSFTFPLADRAATDVDFYLKKSDPALAPAHALFAALLGQLGREVRESGAEFLVTTLPTKIEGVAPIADSRLARPEAVADFVRGLTTREKIGFIDLHRHLPKQPYDRWRLFLEEEYHLNEAGHEYVAEELANELAKALAER